MPTPEHARIMTTRLNSIRGEHEKFVEPHKYVTRDNYCLLAPLDLHTQPIKAFKFCYVTNYSIYVMTLTAKRIILKAWSRKCLLSLVWYDSSGVLYSRCAPYRQIIPCELRNVPETVIGAHKICNDAYERVCGDVHKHMCGVRGAWCSIQDANPRRSRSHRPV